VTKNKAERIMQLEVHEVIAPGCPVTFQTYDTSGIGIGFIVSGSGQTESEALENIVKANYRRVCDELAKEQAHRCANCDKLAPLSFHHKQHRSKGRLDTKQNLEGLCVDCHNIEHGIKKPI
jgi:nitrate/TMAO reductase-like tetraheme cytochrome c subunit